MQRALRPLTSVEQKTLSKYLDETQHYWISDDKMCPEEQISLEDALDLYDGLLFVIQETIVGLFVVMWCGDGCTHLDVWYGSYTGEGIKWTTVCKSVSMDRYNGDTLE